MQSAARAPATGLFPVRPRTASPPVKHQPRFGSAAALALNPMSRLFSFFETQYEPGFVLMSKILANTAPRLAITRNSNERGEVLFNELTQGSTLFLSLPVTSAVGNPIQAKLAGVSKDLIKERNTTALEKAMKTGGDDLVRKLQVAKLGKSIGASLFIASLLIATSYLRNYRTIKKTGFADYKKVIGLGGNTSPTEADRIKAEKALTKNKRIMQGLVAGGLLAWALTMGGAGLIARRGKAIFAENGFLNPKRLADWMKHWAFTGKNSNQINGLFNSKKQTLWVWGIPSFLGWFLGCRDKFELAEQSSKFATFWAGYIGAPMLVQSLLFQKQKKNLTAAAGGALPKTYTEIKEKVAKGLMDKKLGQALIKFKNKGWLALTGLNLLIAGILPLVFNIFFSKWRYQRDLMNRPRPEFNHPGGTLASQPGFGQWIRQVRAARPQAV